MRQGRQSLNASPEIDSIDQDIADLNVLVGSPGQRRRSRKNRADDSDIVEDEDGNLHRQESILSGSFYKGGARRNSSLIKKEMRASGNNQVTVNTVAPGDANQHDKFLDEVLQNQI